MAKESVSIPTSRWVIRDFVRMQKFDRVLNRYDVIVSPRVSMSYHRRLGRTFTGASSTDYDHKTAFLHGNPGEYRRQSQFLKSWNLDIYLPHNNTNIAALDKYVDPETANFWQINSEIRFLARFKSPSLFLIHY